MTKLFCLVGPTATGKTHMAVRVMEKRGGAIVSADARQVYQFLDIGTDKPSEEIRGRVPFAMLDVVTPEQHYSAADFARDAHAVIRGFRQQARPFMLVGGSGLYLKALFVPFFDIPAAPDSVRESLSRLDLRDLHEELTRIDPATARRLHPNDRQRIIRALEVFETTGKTLTRLAAEQNHAVPFSPVYVGLQLPRPVLVERIDARFDQMIARGLLAEVQHLLQMGYGAQTPALDAIGYKELIEHLAGRCTFDEAVVTAKKRSRDYAKRQMTWFRHQPGITWIDAQDPDLAMSEVERRYEATSTTGG